MSKVVRIDLDRLEEYAQRLEAFVRLLKATYPVQKVILFGSFARGEVHEGSDIDLVIIGDFGERFPYRADAILRLAGDLPIEPLVYTPQEWEQMLREGNPFAEEVLRTGKEL
ncbi:MAG: nucleotidyltransferase domain-containing protein [Chloroflexota bacterium]|nr:nucleotidyltransferase domain-containing protein [Chloroflexota bacterium]